MLDDGHLAEQFLVRRLLPGCGFFGIGHSRMPRGLVRDDQDFFAWVQFAQVFLGVLVFELRGTVVLQIRKAQVDLVAECIVLLLDVAERLFKEHVPVKRERKAERHKADHRQPHHDSELFADGFKVAVGHVK